MKSWATVGVGLNFLSFPHFPRNPRPLQVTTATTTAVNTWLGAGVVMPATRGETLLLSAFHVPKPTDPGAPERVRVVTDFRPVNLSVQKPPWFPMPTPDSVATMIASGRYSHAITLDITDAYNHLKLEPVLRGRRLGFLFGDKVLAFWGLGFGLSMAPYVFQTVMCEVVKPMVELCPDSQVVVYLDDILVLSTSFQECQKARNILLQILTSWNFQVAWDKSNLTPATCVRYLGWMWDLQRRTVAVPLDKWKKVKKTIRTHLRRRLLTWKSVASILGTINSLNLVMSHI